MNKRVLFGLAVIAGLSVLTLSGCKKNPHDNTRPPDPWTDKPVDNHHFDGGETDPYYKPGEGGANGGEKPPAKE